MNYNSLHFHIDEGIGYLTLNNPPGNPMSLGFFSELYSICSNQLLKVDLTGLIIQSEGRHFSAGAIIDELLTEVQSHHYDTIPEQMKRNAEAFGILRKLNKPVVALLKGICYGSGFELALCAHIRIAAPNTVISLPEVSFGLMPGLGGIHSLVQIAGQAKATELVLTGTAINANEALKMNLIHEIVNKDKLLQAGIKRIREHHLQSF